MIYAAVKSLLLFAKLLPINQSNVSSKDTSREKEFFHYLIYTPLSSSAYMSRTENAESSENRITQRYQRVL